METAMLICTIVWVVACVIGVICFSASQVIGAVIKEMGDSFDYDYINKLIRWIGILSIVAGVCLAIMFVSWVVFIILLSTI